MPIILEGGGGPHGNWSRCPRPRTERIRKVQFVVGCSGQNEEAGRQTETPRDEGGRQGQTSLGLRSSSPIRLLSVLYVRLPLRRLL